MNELIFIVSLNTDSSPRVLLGPVIGPPQWRPLVLLLLLLVFGRRRGRFHIFCMELCAIYCLKSLISRPKFSKIISFQF